VRQFNSGPDHDIWYRTYRIDTDEWTHTEYVSNTLGNIGESGLPNIDVDVDGNVYIVWRDNSNIYDNGTDDTDIFYRTRNSVTREWSQTEIISTDHYLDDNIPHVQVDSEKNVYVCWDGRTKYILFRFFNQTAKTWSSIYQVNAYSNRSAYFNDMTLDINENLNFVWTDTTNYGSGTDHDIYYVFLNLTTFSFSPPFLISKGSTMSSVFPRQTTDKWGRVHIVWNEGMDFPGYGSDNDIDVAYCSFDMKTQTQSPIELISTESTRDCSTSSVSVDELGNVHIIYMDATDLLNSGPGDDDIFYRLIVYNNTPPEIRDGADLNYELSTLGHSIRWTINDRTLYSGTYKILRNGIVIATGNWNSGSKISFNVDGLDQGFWNFTIVVNDGMYSITQDTIMVHVGPLITPYLIALIVALSITLSVTGFLLYFKKKGYILSKNALKVFISYAEEDYDRFKIEELADSILKTKKVELAFYYKKDMKGDIVSWMEKTVALCQIFLFIASDSSLNSKGCAYELYNAKSHDVSIIPILGTNIEFEQLKSFNNKEYSFGKMHFQLENLDLHKRFGVKAPQDATGSIDVEQLKLVINKEFEFDLDKVRVEFKKSAITNVITVERNIEVNRNDIYLAVRYLVQLGYLEGAWDSDKTQFIVKKEVLHRLNLIKDIRKYDNIEQMILEARFHKDSSEYIQSIFKSPFNKPSNLEIPLTRK
jgi:GR25 family glycosyltransferase involved in LPS biosynthesis